MNITKAYPPYCHVFVLLLLLDMTVTWEALLASASSTQDREQRPQRGSEAGPGPGGGRHKGRQVSLSDFDGGSADLMSVNVHSTPRNCVPIPQGVLWEQLGPDARYASRGAKGRKTKRVSLTDSGKTRRRLPKRLASILRGDEELDEAGTKGDAQLQAFLKQTFFSSSNSTSLHTGRHRHSAITGIREEQGEMEEGVRTSSRRRGKRDTTRDDSSSSSKNTKEHFPFPSSSSGSSPSVPMALRKPPWKCKYKPRWVKMDDNIFPPYIQTGDCQQTECFFGMYQCKPKRYVIKVLKRKKNSQCNPLPLEGSEVTYEEAWEVGKVKVVVSCDCAAKS